MREDQACSIYAEESNSRLSQAVTIGWTYLGRYFGAESAGNRAAAGSRKTALNRPRHPRLVGYSPPASPPGATAGQAASISSLDFQPENVYWSNQKAHVKVFTLRQQSQCLAGRVVRVNQDCIQWEWLYAPGVLLHRRRDSLDQQKSLSMSESH